MTEIKLPYLIERNTLSIPNI